MIRKILQYPNELLFSPSKEIVDFDQSLSDLISDMIETCKQTDNCVGLAAVQIGIPLQLSVIKSGKKYIHIINPVLLSQSGHVTEEWEGCMSVGVGEDQLFSRVARDTKITVRYMNQNKKNITRVCEGFLAHAFLHEMDHMSGVLFLSHVKDPQDIWKDKDLDVYMKKHGRLPL